MYNYNFLVTVFNVISYFIFCYSLTFFLTKNADVVKMLLLLPFSSQNLLPLLLSLF